jgi:hypothetical protein
MPPTQIIKRGIVDHKSFGLLSMWQNKCFAVLTSDRWLRCERDAPLRCALIAPARVVRRSIFADQRAYCAGKLDKQMYIAATDSPGAAIEPCPGRQGCRVRLASRFFARDRLNRANFFLCFLHLARPPDERHKFVFRVATSDDERLFSVDNAQELSEWVDALKNFNVHRRQEELLQARTTNDDDINDDHD